MYKTIKINSVVNLVHIFTEYKVSEVLHNNYTRQLKLWGLWDHQQAQIARLKDQEAKA